MLVDTHCHLDFPEFDIDRDLCLKRAQDAGFKFLVNVGSDLENSVKAVALAQKHDFVYACVGIHPHDADSASDDSINQVRILGENKKVVAIGETGLDYFRNLSGKEKQQSLFRKLLKLSKELSLPVVIHSREAHEDMLAILKSELPAPVKGVIHCFSGDETFLKKALDLGLLVSFTCNITYKKAQNLRDVVKACPLDKMMLETDCPYLSPEGMRGKRNEPVNVKILAEWIAQLKNISADEVGEITTSNAVKFFKVDL
jgi:TatD DNase family protein